MIVMIKMLSRRKEKKAKEEARKEGRLEQEKG